MPVLAVRLLGSFALEYGGAPFRFAATRGAAEVLAYLALRPGQQFSRAALAAAFWPDEPDSVARANLRRHLHRVAKALPAEGSPWIVAVGTSIAWPVRDDVWIDVSDFERFAADPGRLSDAVDLYRGELLEDCYDEWVLADRERLRGSYLNACFELAAHARRDRRFDEALGFVERILAVDEWREDVLRLELAVRYESGDRTGALAAFTQFAARLKAEMGVVPMPETLALRDAILANAPLPGSVRVAADRLSEVRTPLVGRAEELASLDAAWARAARGSGGTIFVGGPAGIGKTRLVGELSANVAAQGGRVLFGGTSNPEAFPYEAVVDALRGGLALLLESQAPPDALARVAGVLPELRAALGEREVPRGDPAGERELLFDAVARIVSALSRARPLLIVLEDLHWARVGTLEMVAELARRVGALPALIVATYRTEEPEARGLGTQRRELQRERRATSTVLGMLAPSDIDVLARAALGEAYAPQIGARVYELCEGNPLFASQLLRGYVERTDGSVEDTMVRSIGGAILARVEALEPSVRALADTAAAIGRSFTLEASSRVLGWSENETLDALGPLLDRGIVREAGGPAFTYTFTHALIANAIYDATPGERRIARHRRIAQVFDALGGDDPETLARRARHWELAGEAERAAPLYRLAAERAVSVYAYDESLDWSARALELWDDPRHRAQTLLVREAAHATRGERAEQRVALDRLADAVREAPDEELQWELLRRRTLLAGTMDELGMEHLVSELRSRAAQANRADWQAEAEKLAAGFAIARNDTTAARAYALDALARYGALESRSGEQEALCLLARVEADSGNLALTREYIERARSGAGATGLAAIAAAANAAAYAANLHQDFAATLEFAQTSLELAERVHDRYRCGNALMLAGIARTRLGDFAGARRALERAFEVFDAMGRRYGCAAYRVNVGVLEYRLGRLNRAYEHLTEALVTFHELGNPGSELIASIDLAALCARLQKVDEATRHANRALELARESGQVPHEASALLALGFAERAGGNASRAVDYLERALALQRRVGRSVDVAEALGNLALAYLAAGRLDDARRAAGELSTSEANIAGAMWPHMHRWTLARVFHAVGDERAARQHLDAAVGAMDSLRAQIAASEDDGPFTALELNAEIARAKREDVWPEEAFRK